MAITRENVYKLVQAHIARIKPGDPPEEPSDQFGDAVTCWEEAFADENVTLKEAYKASRRVARNPPSFWREQLPAVLAAVEVERASNYAQPAALGDVPSDRDAAELESRGCKACGGNGLVIVYHPQWRGGRLGRVCVGHDEHGRRVIELAATEVAAHCDCKLGRWMRSKLDADARRRFPDVEEINAGRSTWRLRPPDSAPELAVAHAG